MCIRRHPRKQGGTGLGAAIRWFTANGYGVAIPLADNQPYGLVVDDGDGPLRGQVRRPPTGTRTEATLSSAGRQAATRASTRSSRSTTAPAILVFVPTDDAAAYLIPGRDISSCTTLDLCAKYERSRLGTMHLQPTPKPLVVGGGFEPP